MSFWQLVGKSIKGWWDDDSDYAPLHVMDFVCMGTLIFLVVSTCLHWAS